MKWEGRENREAEPKRDPVKIHSQRTNCMAWRGLGRGRSGQSTTNRKHRRQRRLSEIWLKSAAGQGFTGQCSCTWFDLRILNKTGTKFSGLGLVLTVFFFPWTVFWLFFFLRVILGFTTKLRGKHRDVPRAPYSHKCIFSPTINIIDQNGTFNKKFLPRMNLHWHLIIIPSPWFT